MKPLLHSTSALAIALLLAAAPAQAIVGGTATADFRHVGVFGVQFTDNWVLAARHSAFAIGSVYSNGHGSATVAARYDLSNADFPQDDLSLLRLDRPLAAGSLALEATLLAAGKLPAPLAVTIASGSNQAPRGYGHTLLQRVVDKVDPDDSGPRPAVPLRWLIAHAADGGAPYVQGGDSGGGLFVGHVTDSTTALLGISSSFIEDASRNPPLRASAFVQLAAHRSWIDNTMAADTADGQTARWVSSVPEPATAWLSLAGLAALLGLQRRRLEASRLTACLPREPHNEEPS